MSNPHNHDYHSALLHAINDAVVAHSYPPMVLFSLKLSHCCGKRIFGQLRHFGRNPPLRLPVERSKFSCSRSRELQRVAHDRSVTYSPSSFLIFDQGMLGSFRRFRTSSRSARSSICSSISKSSIGTTAATGFLPRCTMTRSPPYAARFRMSEKFCRASLAVNLADMTITPTYKTYIVYYITSCTVCNCERFAQVRGAGKLIIYASTN